MSSKDPEPDEKQPRLAPPPPPPSQFDKAVVMYIARYQQDAEDVPLDWIPPDDDSAHMKTPSAAIHPKPTTPKA
jgi:hypothetical protein